MSSTYTFRKTRNGVTSFARVTVDTTGGTVWSVEWSDRTRHLRPIYGAIDHALEQAADACRAVGGNSTAIRIDEIEEVVSDTTLDAVACAAVMAAWTEWNCRVTDAWIDDSVDGRWEVRFRGGNAR